MIFRTIRSFFDCYKNRMSNNPTKKSYTTTVGYIKELLKLESEQEKACISSPTKTSTLDFGKMTNSTDKESTCIRTEINSRASSRTVSKKDLESIAITQAPTMKETGKMTGKMALELTYIQTNKYTSVVG